MNMRMILPVKVIGLVILAMALGACAPGDATQYPVLKWEDINVTIETRPSRAEKGMNEFLVIATRPPRRPASDLVVSIRINDQGKWHQGIQDGHVGVYRRAIFVEDPEKDVLAVRLEHDDRMMVLHFPINPEPAAP